MTKKHRLFRNLVFACVFSISGWAHAQNPSPKLPASLTVVDDYLGAPSWEKTYGKPQSFGLDFVEKILPKSADSTVHSLVKVEPVSTDTVQISIFASDGHPTAVSTLAKADWLANHGNWVRIFIGQTASYGYKITITDVSKVQMQVVLNDSRITVNALQVLTSGQSQVATLTQKFVITNEIPGIGGALLRETTQNMGLGNVRRTQQVTDIND